MITGHCGKTLGTLVALVIVALTFLMIPRIGIAVTGGEICTPAGIVDPSADWDEDGFTNGEECVGNLPVLVMNENYQCVENNDGNIVSIAGYNDRIKPDGTVMDRTQFLDPSGKDLFFVWKEAGIGTMPFDIGDLGSYPLSYYNSGMNVTTHQITLDQTCGPDSNGYETRWVTYHESSQDGQKAVLVAESLTVSTPLGSTFVGTPLTSGLSRIYTQKIWDVVEYFCDMGFAWRNKAICHTPATAACKGDCATSDKLASAKYSIFFDYTRNVVNHEVSHASNLARPYSDADGNHQPEESGFLMEKNIKVVTKKDIIFEISTKYDPNDLQYLQIKGLPLP